MDPIYKLNRRRKGSNVIMISFLYLIYWWASIHAMRTAILAETLKLDLLKAQSQETVDFLVQLLPSDDMTNWEALQAHAMKTQKNLLLELNQLKDQGLVTRIQPYFISNTVAVSGVPKVINELLKLDGIEEISTNRKFESKATSFNERESVVAQNVQWTGAQPHWSLSYINASSINPSIIDKAGELVYANADTGVEFDHPALVGNYLGNSANNGEVVHDYAWWDANKLINITNSRCETNSQKPCDDNNHGTHTMSTVVGSLGLGLSPKTKWMACRNMNMNTGSPESYLGCLQVFLAPTNLKGEDPRSDLRPHVIGNSYGCPPEEGCSQTTFKYAIQALREAGIMMVVSAGNDGIKGCSSISTPPATDPGAFNVAASKYLSDGRAPFSSIGPVMTRNNAIDVTAPGVNITGAVRGGKFDSYQGTSMAAPHVSGAALLIMAACPHLIRQVALIEDLIRSTATPQLATLGCGEDTTSSPNNEFGYGIINVAKAISTCQSQLT